MINHGYEIAQIILQAIILYLLIRYTVATEDLREEAISTRNAQYMPIVKFEIFGEANKELSFMNVGAGVAFNVRAYRYYWEDSTIYFLPKDSWFGMLFTLNTLSHIESKPSKTRKINEKYDERQCIGNDEIEKDIDAIKEKIGLDNKCGIIMAAYDDCAGNMYRTWQFKPQSREDYIKFEIIN